MKSFSHSVIASTWKVRGNLIEKGEIASFHSQRQFPKSGFGPEQILDSIAVLC